MLNFAYHHGDGRYFDFPLVPLLHARGGHLRVILQWMKRHSLLKITYNWHVWYEAVHHGHVHVLQ
jgi:hypothetical protein